MIYNKKDIMGEYVSKFLADNRGEGHMLKESHTYEKVSCNISQSGIDALSGGSGFLFYGLCYLEQFCGWTEG